MRILDRLKKLEGITGQITQDRQFMECQEEVEQWFDDCVRRYNSPEEAVKRQQEYNRLSDIGKRRKRAFYEGLPMPDIPDDIFLKKQTITYEELMNE